MTQAQQAGTMPNTGRWGWYKDHEGREFQRVTSLVKKVETDREGLDKWFQRQVAIGMALRDDLVLAVKAIGRPGPDGYTREQKSDLSKLAQTAFEAAKTTDGGISGTAVHTLTERVDRGESVDQVATGLPATYSLAVRNYAKLIELNGWQVVEIERTIVNDDLNVAGTLDRIYRVPFLAAMLGPGTCQYGHVAWDEHDPATAQSGELPVIGDVKTEGEPWRNGLHIGPQLAIYSRAKRMWLPEGRYVDMPCVRQDIAVVVHVDKETGHVAPLFVDLTAGWRLAQRAGEQRDAERTARLKLGQAGSMFAVMPGIKEPKPAETFVEHAVANRVGTLNPVVTAPPAGTLPVPAVPSAATQEAQRRPDGNVEWVPSGRLDEIDRSAVENIWAATGVEMLAETWRIYTEVCGRAWGGRVAEAADARRRQIECVQRALHTGTGKCACGWNGAQGFPA